MTDGNASARGMPVVDALQVLVELREDNQIVITNQGSARVWPKLAQHPLDFHYNPSTMGGAIPLALGLALAQPRREVLVVSGDGSLLMSLGTLVTVAGSGAANLTIVVLDNGMYEVTGGQKTAATGTPVDLAGLARAAGFPSAVSFGVLSDWQVRARGTLAATGPRFVALQVEATPKELLAGASPPIAEELARFRQALRGAV